MVNGLKAEVRHPQPIDVRINQADRDVTTAMALIEHLLVGDARKRTFAQKHDSSSSYSWRQGCSRGSAVIFTVGPPGAHHRTAARRVAAVSRMAGKRL